VFCGDVPAFCESGRAAVFVPLPTDMSPHIAACASRSAYLILCQCMHTTAQTARDQRRPPSRRAPAPRGPIAAPEAPPTPPKDADNGMFPRLAVDLWDASHSAAVVRRVCGDSAWPRALN
jgi:hypothetical protein